MELWFDVDSSYRFQFCRNGTAIILKFPPLSLAVSIYFSLFLKNEIFLHLCRLSLPSVFLHLPFHLFISLASLPSLITIIPLIKQLTCLLQKLINLLSSPLFLWSSPHVSSCLVSTLSSFHIFLFRLHPSCYRLLSSSPISSCFTISILSPHMAPLLSSKFV